VKEKERGEKGWRWKWNYENSTIFLSSIEKGTVSLFDRLFVYHSFILFCPITNLLFLDILNESRAVEPFG